MVQQLRMTLPTQFVLRALLACRLNLHHHWATVRTEEGMPYLQCQRCGKDETDIFAGTRSGRELDGVPPGIGSATFHGPTGSG